MNTKSRTEIVDDLENALMDDILAMPMSDIDQELNKFGASDHDYVSRTLSFISDSVAASRKQLLVDARAAINTSSTTPSVGTLITTVKEAQEFIYNLLISPNLKENQLTTAFRDGEDIPENDLISMANELKQLMERNEAED